MFSNGEVRTAVAAPRFNPPGGNCPLKRSSNGEVRTAVAGPRFNPPGGNCPLKRSSNGEVRTAVAGPNCHEVAPKVSKEMSEISTFFFCVCVCCFFSFHIHHDAPKKHQKKKNK